MRAEHAPNHDRPGKVAIRFRHIDREEIRFIHNNGKVAPATMAKHEVILGRELLGKWHHPDNEQWTFTLSRSLFKHRWGYDVEELLILEGNKDVVVYEYRHDHLEAARTHMSAHITPDEAPQPKETYAR